MKKEKKKDTSASKQSEELEQLLYEQIKKEYLALPSKMKELASEGEWKLQTPTDGIDNLYLRNVATLKTLKVKNTLQAYPHSCFLSCDDTRVPSMQLCQLYGELVFKVGASFVPFSEAIEFQVTGAFRDR